MSPAVTPNRSFACPRLEGTSYANAFQQFRANNNQRQLMTDWVNLNVDQLIDRKIEVPRVLSVGGGNGAFDCAIIPFFVKGRAGLHYEVVEPNYALRVQFESAASLITEASFKFHATTLEKCNLQNPVDLVLMSHCLYYIPDRVSAIKAALSVSPRILVFNSTEKGLSEVRGRFQKSLSGEEPDYFTASQLEQICESLGVRSRTEMLPSLINVSLVLSAPEYNRDLLSFLVGCDCANLPVNVCHEVASFLSTKCIKKDRQHFLPQPVAAIIIDR